MFLFKFLKSCVFITFRITANLFAALFLSVFLSVFLAVFISEARLKEFNDDGTEGDLDKRLGDIFAELFEGFGMGLNDCVLCNEGVCV